MSITPNLSNCQKRKCEEEEDGQTENTELLKFVKISPSSSATSSTLSTRQIPVLKSAIHSLDVISPPAAFADPIDVPNPVINIDVTSDPSDVSIENNNSNLTATNVQVPMHTTDDDTFDDPANWPNLTKDIIKLIVEKGPVQIKSHNFPYTHKRRFSFKQYNKINSNGEVTRRDCIGYSNWGNVHRGLQEHESSRAHLEALNVWKNYKLDLEYNAEISTTVPTPPNKSERGHWKEILKRFFIFARFLGTQSVEFTNPANTMFEQNNGNFFKLMEAVGKFDITISEHLRRINSNEIQYIDTIEIVQNQLIANISDSVKHKIVRMIKNAHFFSIIMNCTNDKSHTEHVSLVIRFVQRNDQGFKIAEHFLGFLESFNGTGSLLAALKKLGLSINHCRGIGYDTGTNIKLKQSDMQTRISSLEPRAFFIPCAVHSLNTVVYDAAHCVFEVSKFFDIVQNLYIFFSSSTKRWSILQRNIKKITTEPESDTPWSSCIDAIRPLKLQLVDVYETLIEISETSDNSTKVTAEDLGNKILDFHFICSTLIWHDILEKINRPSQYLQGVEFNITAAVNMLNNVKTFLEELRSDSKFENYINKANRLAIVLKVNVEFPARSSLQSRRKKSLIKYEFHNEPASKRMENYKLFFYYKILDQSIQSISERLEQFKTHQSIFEFLYDIQSLSQLSSSRLNTLCMNLQQVLKSIPNDHIAEINGHELFAELGVLPTLLKPKTGCIDVLNYIFTNKFETDFPNTVTVIKILLTIPVTVASGESTFSKLKMIKTYLGSKSQDKSFGLATLLIEKPLVESLDYNQFVNYFIKIKF